MAGICLHKATVGRSSSELVQESGPTEGQTPVLRKRFHIQPSSFYFSSNGTKSEG